MRNRILIILCAGLLFSCTKDPGDGGNSALEGTVNFELRSVLVNYESVLYQGPAKDWDVYLVYGNDGIGYDDKTSTDYNGEYKFEFLREGDYTVYAYSQDTINGPINNGAILDLPIIRQVEITEKKQLLRCRKLRSMSKITSLIIVLLCFFQGQSQYSDFGLWKQPVREKRNCERMDAGAELGLRLDQDMTDLQSIFTDLSG